MFFHSGSHVRFLSCFGPYNLVHLRFHVNTLLKNWLEKSKASSTRALNFFMRSLYRSNVFIPSNEAAGIINAGWHFLKAYARLAFLSHQAKESRFPLLPKAHMLYHVVHWMKVQRLAVAWVENPIQYSCASDEDFIGRFCALTRAVSPRQRILRSLQRYLSQVSLYWGRTKGCQPRWRGVSMWALVKTGMVVEWKNTAMLFL